MAGRPTSLTKEVISAIEKVINEEILFLTDTELVECINEQLPEDKRFSYEAFSKWKRGERQADNPLISQFVRLIKKALAKEKKRLLEKLEGDKQAWQRYAWILERKFDEWNIKTKSEVDHNINIPSLPDIVIK